MNESRPGVSSTILSPTEAIDRVEVVIERTGGIAAIGVAGPVDAPCELERFGRVLISG